MFFYTFLCIKGLFDLFLLTPFTSGPLCEATDASDVCSIQWIFDCLCTQRLWMNTNAIILRCWKFASPNVRISTAKLCRLFNVSVNKCHNSSLYFIDLFCYFFYLFYLFYLCRAAVWAPPLNQYDWIFQHSLLYSQLFLWHWHVGQNHNLNF